MSNEPWVEKYRPKSFKDWIGDAETKGLIEGFFDRWEKGDPISKVLILHGAPGIGKTSSVYAIAADRGYVVREFNAGTDRTKDVLREALTETLFRPVDGSMKVVLLDEVEGMTISKAIDSLKPEWKKVASPVVITTNDISQFPKSLTGRALSLHLITPSKTERLDLLRKINKDENLNIPFIDLARIASKVKTLRSAISTLQMCVISADFVHIKAVDIPPEFNELMLNYLNGSATRPPGITTGFILRFFEENRLPSKDVMTLNILLKKSKSVSGLSDITDGFADMCKGKVTVLRFPKSHAKDIEESTNKSHVKREKKSKHEKKGKNKGKGHVPRHKPQVKFSSWGTYG
jgi:DNA polymerase III delta prime subunit